MNTNGNITKTVFRSISWLAIFKFSSQILSWVITLIIARILSPDDYGLMALATIITGYVELFSELGLGAAIIQKEKITQTELSSVFWFALTISILLGALCFPLSNLTANIMNEPRVIPLTRFVAIHFVISGLYIVPSNLLRKDLKFKELGFIELIAVMTSLIVMLIIAIHGGGAWALLSGSITRKAVDVMMIYPKAGWYPKFRFNIKDAFNLLKFGSVLALGRSMYYMQERSDSFFAGRLWKSGNVGLYGFAKQLAQIPTDRIVSLVNQVSFPAFSKIQDQKKEFKELYLRISKLTMFIVIPLFTGGFLLGELLIGTILETKWFSMHMVFRYLCIAQIFVSMNAINNFVHVSQGRPVWSLYYNIVSAVIMPIAFYIMVPYGLNAMIAPWISVFVVICIIWTIITLKKIKISLMEYIKNLRHPFQGSLLIALTVTALNKIINQIPELTGLNYMKLAILITCGAATYFIYYWSFDKTYLTDIYNKLKLQKKVDQKIKVIEKKSLISEQQKK